MSPSDCHVLLLEDEPAVLRLVLAMLRKAGFSQVSTSSSVAGARQCWHAQTGKFDLLLTDFSLPDGSAPEFIEELLRAKPGLHVILMTGFSEEEIGLNGAVAQATKVLSKPFHPSKLLEIVNAETQPHGTE